MCIGRNIDFDESIMLTGNIQPPGKKSDGMVGFENKKFIADTFFGFLLGKEKLIQNPFCLFFLTVAFQC